MRKQALEIFSVVAATVVAAYLLSPGRFGFTGIQPHPYLIPVATLAYRYGLRAGLAGALLLSLAYPYSWLDWPHSGVIASLFLAGVVLGSLTARHRDQTEELRRQLAQAQTQKSELQEQNKTLEEAVRELRSRVLGQTETFASLYTMARRLTTMRGQELYQAVLELAVQQTKATSVYLWLEERVVASTQTPKLAPESSMLVASVQDQKKTLAIRDLPKGQSAEEPIVATPLFLYEGDQPGRVVGALVIEDLPFERYHPSTLATLAVISDWASRALSQLTRFSVQEEVLAQERDAFSRLLSGLRERPLEGSALELLKPLAGPLTPMLLETLGREPDSLILKDNLLQLLAHSSALNRQALDQLALFAKQEHSWANHYAGVLSRIEGSEWRNQLGDLGEALKRVIHLRRILHARMQALSEQVPYRVPDPIVITPKTPPIGKAEVEEIVLEAMSSPVPELMEGAIYSLAQLLQLQQFASLRESGPGSPISEARALLNHPEPRVREAAAHCLDSLSAVLAARG